MERIGCLSVPPHRRPEVVASKETRIVPRVSSPGGGLRSGNNRNLWLRARFQLSEKLAMCDAGARGQRSSRKPDDIRVLAHRQDRPAVPAGGVKINRRQAGKDQGGFCRALA